MVVVRLSRFGERRMLPDREPRPLGPDALLVHSEMQIEDSPVSGDGRARAPTTPIGR